MRQFKIQDAKSGSAITVKVTPHAKADAVAGVMADGTIKISLRAKPVDGEANEALIEFLAEQLDLPKSQIDILAGRSSTQKLVCIVGMTPAAVEQRLVPEEKKEKKEKKAGGKKKKK